MLMLFVKKILTAQTLYQLNMKLHIILTPPNLPLPRGGAEGGGVLSMHLHMEMVLTINNVINWLPKLGDMLAIFPVVSCLLSWT
ncbi:hypothetical protein NIES4106_14980 [Fischerella sp. NIES-4106]|jgi:hypothetical protein|nr:hypothetical protein NIES4106_14980 [Fischerella sp. NIES-4106]